MNQSDIWFYATLKKKKKTVFFFCHHQHLLHILITSIYSLNNCLSKFLLCARHCYKCWGFESDQGRQEFWLQMHGSNQINTTIMDFNWVMKELDKTLRWRWRGWTPFRMCGHRRPYGNWGLYTEKRFGGRALQAEERSDVTGLRRGELDIVLGSSGAPKQDNCTAHETAVL